MGNLILKRDERRGKLEGRDLGKKEVNEVVIIKWWGGYFLVILVGVFFFRIVSNIVYVFVFIVYYRVLL